MNAAIPRLTQLDRNKISNLFQYGIFGLFLLLVVFFSTRNPNFLTINNILLILQQSAPIGIAVIGMTFVLMIGGIDISVGQNMFLTAMLVGVLMEAMKPSGFLGTPLSYVAIYSFTILISGLVGAINGFFIARVKIIPFITTLATMGICRGLGLMASNSQAFYLDMLSPISNGRFLGIPVVVLMLVVLMFVFDYILRRTPFGLQLKAIGNQAAGAERIGINVKRNTFLVYVLCGILAGIGGILSAGQVASVAINFADGNEFLIISAAVLGGTSLFGGKGTVFPGAIFGILLVTTIINGMTMMNASPYAYRIVRGIIIFMAVMIDSVNFKGELR